MRSQARRGIAEEEKVRRRRRREEVEEKADGRFVIEARRGDRIAGPPCVT